MVGAEYGLEGRVGKSIWFPPQMSKDYPSALALYPSSSAVFCSFLMAMEEERFWVRLGEEGAGGGEK